MSNGIPGPRLFGVLGWCFLICAILVGVSRFRKTSLPGPDAIDKRLHAQPVQTDTTREPFEFDYHTKKYLITPRAEYEISGLVVAHNDVSSLGDIYHDADAVDIKDLGLIWGDNLSKNPYREVSFKANCYVVEWRYPSGVEFDHDQISNNHLLSGDPAVRKAIMNAKVGDQVWLKGMLVDYKDLGSGRERKTSLSRTDTWMGACEVMFVEEAKVVQVGNAGWAMLYTTTSWGAIASLVILIGAFIFKVNMETKELEAKRKADSEIVAPAENDG